MAGGPVLAAAAADLAALPAGVGVYEQQVASEDVVALRQRLGQRPRRTKEEDAFVVNTQDAFEQLREEGRREGSRHPHP